MEKALERQIERCIKKAQKFNERLKKYVDETGDDELPEIDSTCLSYSKLIPYTWERTENGIVFDCDDYKVNIEAQLDEDEWWLSGVEEFEYCIKYDDRRIRKAWRLWESEDPDKELEKDDDD